MVKRDQSKKEGKFPIADENEEEGTFPSPVTAIGVRVSMSWSRAKPVEKFGFLIPLYPQRQDHSPH